MTFRMESTARGQFRVFVVSGRIQTPAITELRRLLELQTDCRDVILDLKGVTLVDRDVMRFFASCEAAGAKLENCAP